MVRRADCFPAGTGHDVTEVSPGKVLTSTVPMYLLDATDPSDPQVLAVSEPKPGSGHDVLFFVTDEVVYTTDGIRGIDILRWNGGNQPDWRP